MDVAWRGAGACIERLRAYLPGILVVGYVPLCQDTSTQESMPLAGPLNEILAKVDGYRIEEQHVSDEERKRPG